MVLRIIVNHVFFNYIFFFLQEIFQSAHYKIEQLEDEDGEMTVHQLTISKPMHKVGRRRLVDNWRTGLTRDW